MPSPITIAAARRIPWRKVLAAGALAFQRGSAAWKALTTSERQAMRELIAKSKGRPGNLTARERQRLRSLAAKALRGIREGK